MKEWEADFASGLVVVGAQVIVIGILIIWGLGPAVIAFGIGLVALGLTGLILWRKQRKAGSTESTE